MRVKNIAELGKVIDLCRKKGVRSISIDGVHLSLGDVPEPNTQSKDTKDIETEGFNQFTEEQIATWSSGS